jgi:starch synthase
MKVIHFSTEFAPIAKAGGLGDVLVGLSRELMHLGVQVEILLPKYDILPKSLNIKKESLHFPCMERGITYDNTIWKGEVEGCQLSFLDTEHPKHYFRRGKIYGCGDDIARFLYFCKAGCEYLQTLRTEIDVLHLHDWPTAIAAILVRDMFRLPVKKIVLTVHNAEYQGLCSTWDLDALGLQAGNYLTSDKMQDDHPQHAHLLNLLKGGIVYADKVNTVSPSYAAEVMTPEIGHFISATFRKYRHKICGILNGIDPVLWNPKTDPALNQKYCAQDSSSRIAQAKQAAKEQICSRFGISLTKTPWIGSITRIVPQKGPELIEAGLRKVEALGATFVLLGSSPIPSLQHHFDGLKQEFSKTDNVCLHFEYDETLSHQLYAALDFLLMPSLFEPCGLSQLIAMRYGTIPIVRATGGLKDTVVDEECATAPIEKRNGIVFTKHTQEDLLRALTRVFQMYRGDVAHFHAMAQRIMRPSYDWKKSAKLYLQMYTDS